MHPLSDSLRRTWLALASLAVLFAAGSCSSSDDDPAEPPYLNLSPQSLRFNEASAEENVVAVEANGFWRVSAETAALRFTPSEGTGDGRIRILDAPKGEAAVLTVTMGDLKRTVAVTRSGDDEKTELTLSPETLEFDPADPSANRIDVKSNVSWKATASDPALTFTPASGTGDGTITVTGAVGNETATLTVTAGEGADAVTRTVAVSYPVVVHRTVYFDDFDNAAVSGSVWVNVDASSWPRPTGEGAGAVSYEGAQAQVRNDSYGSASVGSGKNYVRLYFEGWPDPVFLVKGIALPADERDFTLSMSASFTEADCAIDLSADGKVWKRIAYTGVPTYNRWGTISTGFTLAAPAETLYIRFTPYGPKQSFGINFDDLKLSAGGGGQVITFEKSSYRWAELPENAVSTGDFIVNTHWAETVTSRQHVRNYTYCYDTRRHCPLWIAHPQHACYEEGTGRTNVWAGDPYMTDKEQAIIYPLAADGNRALSLFTPELGLQWQRGHMLMSNYRGGSGERINAQTFYSCNIAPQYPSGLFQTLWGEAEIKIDEYVCADTLYCVSGTWFADDRLVAYDASRGEADNRYYVAGYSKPCVVPTHFYKVVLRTRNGNTGKPVQECSAEELKAVGFWFEHTQTGTATLRSAMKSVAEIEALTGQTFFPDVPESVKEQCNPADWDL